MASDTNLGVYEISRMKSIAHILQSNRAKAKALFNEGRLVKVEEILRDPHLPVCSLPLKSLVDNRLVSAGKDNIYFQLSNNYWLFSPLMNIDGNYYAYTSHSRLILASIGINEIIGPRSVPTTTMSGKLMDSDKRFVDYLLESFEPPQTSTFAQKFMRSEFMRRLLSSVESVALAWIMRDYYISENDTLSHYIGKRISNGIFLRLYDRTASHLNDGTLQILPLSCEHSFSH